MTRLKKRISIAITSIIALLGMAAMIPAAANASGESAAMAFSMKPRSGVFYKQAYRPANWEVKATISTPDPVILPMKKADIRLPGRGQMNFTPNPRIPVCPDNKVGPAPVNVSVPVATIVKRCGKSIIGNGTAVFVLNRNNQTPTAALDGYMLVLNGGKVNGQARLKVYAFSYDTGVGIYTEAKLTSSGRLVFQIPLLTVDSSVSHLDLRIPSRNRQFYLPTQDITINLPAGRDGNYVKARCFGNSWGYSGTFDLGTRDSAGNPTSPTTAVGDSGNASCTGYAGRPKLKNVAVKGPRGLNRRGSKVYRVTVRNSGTAKANGVRIRVDGRWVRKSNRRVSSIPAGQARTYRVRVGLISRQVKRKRGKSTAIRFVASARKAGHRKAYFRVKVR